MIRRILFCVITTALLSSCTANHVESQSSSLDDDFVRFSTWFAGEFDNNEQVWQQAEDKVPEADRHERIHHIFKPVSAPAIGKSVYFVKQYMDGDYENVYRQRLYGFTKDLKEDAIRLAIYTFKDKEKYQQVDVTPDIVKNIRSDELTNMPGCDVFWRFNGDHFVGTMKENACFYFSKQRKKNIYIKDTLKLTESEIWIGDKAYDEQGNKIFGREVHHKNRKVRYFTGWALIKNKILDPNSKEPEEVTFYADLRLHNEGQKVALISDKGVDSGYTIELTQLTYQSTNTPILKLGLIENKTGKTVKYIWADIEAKRLGMNLRWMQVGLTSEEIKKE